MTEENPEELSAPGDGDAAKVTTDEMADAIEAVKAASPDLAAALDAAQITPDQLADAREAAEPTDEG